MTNPRVVIEVLSPSTEEYDRGEKRENYQQLDSLEEYVLVAQDRRRVEVFWRKGGWRAESYGAGDTAELVSLGVSLRVLLKPSSEPSCRSREARGGR